MTSQARPSAPTSNGAFARTPFAHLLVYALDKALDGTFDFTAPDGATATLTVSRGRPVKLRLDATPLNLGQVLVELGYLTAEQRDGSLGEFAAAKILHGQLLLASGLIDEVQLQEALRVQLLRKLGVLFEWPPESTFAFYAGLDGLDDWGGDSRPVDPAPAIWSGIREAAPLDAANSVLERLKGSRIRLAKGALLDRFEFRAEERRWLGLLRIRPLTVDELVAGAEGLGERAARLLTYCLLITKQVEPAPAAGEEENPPPSSSGSRKVEPDSSSRLVPAAAASSSTPLGRVALKKPDLSKSYPVIEEHLIRSAVDRRASPPPGTIPPQDDPRKKEIVARASGIDKEDYFQMLGLTQQATPEEVKAAYFALARIWHPDKLPAHLADVKDSCSRVFARMSEAHQTLSDPKLRARYIQVMKEGGATPEEQEVVANVVEATVNFQKAEICIKRNDLAQAETLARKAHVADPQQAEYLALLTWIESMKPGSQGLEDTLEKIEQMSKAIGLNPKCERAYFYRAMLHKRLGNESKSYKDFQKSLELNPRNVDSAREIRLQEMRGQVTVTEPGKPTGKSPPPAKPGLFDRFFKKS